MSPKQKQRMYGVLALVLCIGLASFCVLYALGEGISLFYTPTKLLTEKENLPLAKVKLGGMIVKGSIEKNNLLTCFSLTDYQNTLRVEYTGLLPDLFKEEQGIVAIGHYNGKLFIADELLAKHDEKYMPPELIKGIKDAEAQNAS